MRLFNNFSQMCQILFIVINYIFFVDSGRATKTTTVKPGISDANETNRIPISVVFDQNSTIIQRAFRVAMVEHRNYLNFQVFVDIINTADVFKLSKLVCNQFSRGVVALLANVHPDSFQSLHSYANTFQIPFITPVFPEKVQTPTSGLPDIALSILPDYHEAVLGILEYYGWRNVIYLYDSDDGLLRLQQLFKTLVPGKPPYFRIANVKRVTSAMDVIIYLRELEKTDRWTNKYVILDCSTTIAKETIITHVRDVQLGRRNYHYLFSGLVLDDRWDRQIREFGTINITGFRMVDNTRKFVKDFFKTWDSDYIAASGALMYDATHTLLETFQRLLKYKPHIIENLMNKSNHKYRFLNCDDQNAVPLKYGEEISNFMKMIQVEGLSGKISFSNKGIRLNFSLAVVRNTPDGNTTKVATWYDDKGFRPFRKRDRIDVSGKYDRNKVYTVLSIREPPYFISSKPKEGLNLDQSIFIGFCAELAEIIAEKLEITIQFRLSADGKYGNVNPSIIGGWDGMIGELVRREIDMVVAPLTVTAEREAVVDFSKAFLSFNRIAPKKQKEKVAIYGFLKPLSEETWYLIAFSVALVSVTLYVVSRFSPMEWRVVTVSDTTQSSDHSEAPPVTRVSVINKFSFINSIWYSICSVMQQGSELAPRSFSGRIVSTVWCFFVLIMISSYTANMTSQRILTGLQATMLPIHSRVASCPEDMEVKKREKIVIVDELHGNGDTLDGLHVKQNINYNCEMLVTALHPGIMEFAIAFPKGSKLRTGVNIALSDIKASGEMNRLIRKYFHITDAAKPSMPEGGTELTLGDVSGLFYILLIGTGVAIITAILEFCCYHRSDVAKANISLRTALCAKSQLQLNEPQEPRNTNRRRRRHRDQEPPLNGTEADAGSYAGLHAPFDTSPDQCPMKAVGPRLVVTRQRSRRVVQQAQKSREATEHGLRPYFTPANHNGQEETALRNSLSQV